MAACMTKTDIKKLILPASLALNLFLIGFIIPFHGPCRPPHGGPIDHMIHATKVLSPDSKEKVENILKIKKTEMDKDFLNMKDDFQSLREILTNKKTTDEDLDKLFLTFNENKQKMHNYLQKLTKDIFEAIPNPDERVLYFKESMPRDFPPPPPPPRNPSERQE